jgi:hypothetical protein
MPCKVCENPKAIALVQKVYLGKMTYVEAAKELNLPKPTVWNCFNKHYDIQTEGEKVRIMLKEADGDVGEFVNIIRDQMEMLLQRLADANDGTLPFDPRTEKALVSLTKEIRGIMRDILEFQGKLTKGIHVKYQVLSLQFNNLTSFLFSNLCEEDRKKLLIALPELKKIGPNGTPPVNLASTK